MSKQKNGTLIPNIEQSEDEKQSEVWAAMVTACPKQPEGIGSSEFIENVLPCYISVKC